MSKTSRHDPSGQLGLRQGEDLLRIDPVVFTRTASTAFWPNTQDDRGSLGTPGYAYLALTSQRLIFLRGVAGWLGRVQQLLYFLPVLNAVSLILWGRPPFIGRQDFELADIERFWTWKPEFSGPPAFDIGTSAWSFGLVTTRRGFQLASTEDLRAHFRFVEAAWNEARAE
jgi:hypothetical protein